MRIGDLLKQGTDFLKYRKNAVLDCEVVLAHVLGVDSAYLLAHNNEEVSEDLYALFGVYLKRLKSGEPVAYIVQEKEFFGLNFFVDKRVLVPRPETELLVEKVIEYINAQSYKGTKLRILDVGTGSGNIAVALARYFEDNGLDLIDEIVAVDSDEAAIEVAKINIEQHTVDHKINVFQSDLLEVLEDYESFDIIVANLPYIGEVENRFVSADVEKYEPSGALFAGNDGLELYKKMFQQIKDKNINFDIMIGEFGFGQKKSLEEVLNKYFEHEWDIEQDLAGIDRVFIINKENVYAG